MVRVRVTGKDLVLIVVGGGVERHGVRVRLLSVCGKAFLGADQISPFFLRSFQIRGRLSHGQICTMEDVDGDRDE